MKLRVRDAFQPNGYQLPAFAGKASVPFPEKTVFLEQEEALKTAEQLDYCEFLRAALGYSQLPNRLENLRCFQFGSKFWQHYE